GATQYVAGIEAPGANPELLYPIALANSLAGDDLDPTRPDIRVTLNTAPDDLCRSRTGGFYYGFDGHAGDSNDLVEIVLHELAHGLGFASIVDDETGELADGYVDAFSAQLFDLDSERSWTQLTAAERARSAQNPRKLAWSGAAGKRVAAEALTVDEPRVVFQPRVPEWSGMVSDTSFGRAADELGVTGVVVLAQGCSVSAPADPTTPWIALFTDCHPVAAAGTAATAGASGAFLITEGYAFPPSPVESASVATPYMMPLVVLSPADARNVQLTLARQGLTATITSDPGQRLGTDETGRPLMFSPNPVRPGSSVSHVDQSMRPNQMMEPTATPNATHDLSLTRAFLQDVGWSARCGDGVLDPTEECDEGLEGNSKLVPNGCRSSCQKAYCGDGVRDRDEDCDDGLNNSDSRKDACRKDCKRAHCGDGVLDDKEECDEGKGNDDSGRDGCRASCRLAHCGDGVVDALEQCDDGDKNADDRADACRKDCRTHRCGDGVVDQGEECDEGAGGTSACRQDCTQPICGDGVVDEGEACDGSRNCTASCQPEETETQARTAEMPLRETPLTAAADAGAADAGEPAAEPSPDAGGCGC
ncbi:MAG TPA: hypothetical protein VMF89_02185, partial [Polyangiales bacterium]|nr:hypothetical protein [Polyangiales bacterium]